jgi:hypothetical protein
MYYILGIEENLHTLVSLGSPFGSTTSLEELRHSIGRFLRQRSAKVPYGIPSFEAVHFDSPQETLRRLAELFEVSSNVDASDASLVNVLFEESLIQIRQREPGLAFLLDAGVDFVFTSSGDAPGSLSTGRALGVIWIGAERGQFRPGTVSEALVHELTHTLAMYDELLHPLFVSYAAANSVQVPSAIRNALRPLPAVFASIVVSAELIEWRKRWPEVDGGEALHGTTTEIVRRTKIALASLDSVDNLPQILTPRATEILDRCREVFALVRS